MRSPTSVEPARAAEHDLQRALEGEDVGVEARAGRHLGEQVLDVVELARVAERVGQVVDLLPEQESLFVVEHGSLLLADRCVTAPRAAAPASVRGWV